MPEKISLCGSRESSDVDQLIRLLTLEWRIRTPLGVPVDPDVNMIYAVESPHENFTCLRFKIDSTCDNLVKESSSNK